MTSAIDALIARARTAAAEPRDRTASGDDRQRLASLAAEFESMLLVQVLRDMRRSGRWGDEGESGGELESLFDTMDVELAGHLARTRGLGLAPQLMDAFDRLQPGGAPAGTVAASRPSPVSRHTDTPRHRGVDVSDGVVLSQTPQHHQHPVNLVNLASPEGEVRPVSGAVTSAFGWRRDPFTGEAKFHKGIDLKAAYGEAVQAAASGRVVFCGTQGGYGTTVMLEHPDGTRTRYAHLSAVDVEAGAVVEAGQCIGRAGRSGRATGTHVHFERLTADGRHVAPIQGFDRVAD